MKFLIIVNIIFAVSCAHESIDIKFSKSIAKNSCAMIYTDDDVPSGHESAQAMYSDNQNLGVKLLTSDVLAVARGFKDRGIACVDVIDTHNGAIDSIPLNKIGVRVLTIRDHRDELQEIFQNHYEKYSVAALVGFHAPAGLDGISPHTFDDHVKSFKINGELVGEVAYQIISFASKGLPVVLISGSQLAIEEGQKYIKNVGGVNVRWKEPDGKIKFLKSEDASKKLYEMAKNVQFQSLEFNIKKPISIDYELHVKGLIPKKSDAIDAAFADYKKDFLKNNPFKYSDSMSVSERRFSWLVSDLDLLDKTVPFTRSYFKGQDTWELVTVAYNKFKQKQYAKAAELYAKALELNPYDLPTHCRLAAVYRTDNQKDKALKHAKIAIDRIDEVGSQVMKDWCLSEYQESQKN